MHFIEFLERMMSLTQLIYPSKGLDNNNNNQSFEPGQAGSISIENFIKNFPAFSNFKIPTMATIKSLFIEKYNEATWKNVHKFILDTCSPYNNKQFFMALQFTLCVLYFPGVALGIVYQCYELEQQPQQDEEQDIYQVILQEMQQQQPQQPQQPSISREYIRQQLHEQDQLQPFQQFNKQSMSQSSPMMQFARFILGLIEQLIQTPQSMLYQIQYQQDCQYINQTIQAMQQQTDQQYVQYQCYQNQNAFNHSNQEEEMHNVQDMNMKQCMIINQPEQVIIVMIQQKSQVLRATTNSTQNNENGGVNNMMITVIRVKLPKEGRQIIQF